MVGYSSIINYILTFPIVGCFDLSIFVSSSSLAGLAAISHLVSIISRSYLQSQCRKPDDLYMMFWYSECSLNVHNEGMASSQMFREGTIWISLPHPKGFYLHKCNSKFAYLASLLGSSHRSILTLSLSAPHVFSHPRFQWRLFCDKLMPSTFHALYGPKQGNFSPQDP